MAEERRSMYRLNGVAHVAGSIGDEPTRCIYSVRRQQNMPLHDRIIPYLEMAGLYHLARLNSHWFWLDEPLVSAFVERWRPETHTFHMPFGECTVTLQDVAFQLGLPVDGEAVSGCLGEFETYIEGGRPACEWFQDLFGELPPPNKVKQMTVHFTWFHERFSVLPPDANEETVRIYARAYIMMLLSTQLFGDKSANWIHIRWLPFVANLDEMGRYSWGSAAWSAYLPPNDGKEQRVISYRLALDRMSARDIIWEPYSALDVLAVVHPEILTDEHSRIWRAVTSLIYFVVIEWHQVDRVVPQLGGVQHIPEDALNIDWLHAKDGRGGDRWFPHYYRDWHLHWGSRLDAVISIERVADPGPSADYLDWWYRDAHRFLSPGAAFTDPRGTEIPEEALQIGSSQVPRKSQLPHIRYRTPCISLGILDCLTP
ncbi:serine/threonine-protein phosphatase 7 long form homolog [Arachis hypogaea]|uniref:serine/threonine-protein phosphatase 7 long form homolog n=1 Tax=Arachis hypogaea TaxID=3818 RepID=UPI000DEC3FB5|nr:serine/threonine-protein phosphatase 7 long form homolog [Arachis hypogaea]